MFPFDVTSAYFRLVQVKLAAHAYRKRYHRAVSNIERLAPKFVATAQDPFSGEPLRVKTDLEWGRVTIYSVGPDMDDDGGHPAQERFWSDSDGDLPRVFLR